MRSIATFLALTAASFAALVPQTARADDFVLDPLTDASSPAGRGVQGGSFSPSGWTTTGPTDTVWWEVPAALESGSVEVTVTGLSIGGTLVSSETDLIDLYQAPDGAAEPVDYSPWFRNNDLKVFLRVFGPAVGVDRQGGTKLNLTACMQGPPYYHDSCPAGCPGVDTFAYAYGSVNGIPWDPSHAYRLAVTWGSGTMSFYRDGESLGSVGYPGTYAPSPLRVRLGGARNGQVPESAMPVGITFSDLAVRGTPGTQTPACGAQPADAGTTPGGDGGACGPGVLATQDATAANWESGVFPTPGDLNVEGDGAGGASGVVYLRFPAPGGAVARATLTLHTQTFSSAAGGSGEVCPVVGGSTWDEATLTWANRPATGTPCSGNARAVASDADVQWDVTAQVAAAAAAGREVNLAVVSTDGDGAHYLSRESGGCTLGPRLLVELAPPPNDAGVGVDAGSARDAGAGGASDAGDAGPRDAGGGADTGRVDAAADARVDGGGPDAGAGGARGGCGCAVPAGHGSYPEGWFALGAVVAAAMRRRRVRR